MKATRPRRLVRNHFDGPRHMGVTGVRKQFEAVCDAAGLRRFQLNGWRHTAITRMPEAGVHIATIMARAGHCSPKMTAHYTQMGMQARADAKATRAAQKDFCRPSNGPSNPGGGCAPGGHVTRAGTGTELRYHPSAVKEEPKKGPQLITFTGAG